MVEDDVEDEWRINTFFYDLIGILLLLFLCQPTTLLMHTLTYINIIILAYRSIERVRAAAVSKKLLYDSKSG